MRVHACAQNPRISIAGARQRCLGIGGANARDDLQCSR
jgi:hypothetical protein